MGSRLRQLVAVVVAIAAIAVAALVLPGLNDRRAENHMLTASLLDDDALPELDDKLAESTPPEIQLLSLLGPARPALINLLWIRAEKMKQEGRFFEYSQLAPLICHLQPRYSGVWAFQSWNLAYNLTQAETKPEVRWQWIEQAMSLLRDKGLHYNPTSMELYRELSWLFYFKIGDRMDDEHQRYKRYWAREMHTVLGDPPIGETQAVIDWFAQIADAPPTLDKLASERPELADAIQTLRTIQPDGVGFDTLAALLFLDRFASFEAVTDNATLYRPGSDGQRRANLSPPLQRLATWMSEIEPEHRDAILSTVRHGVLRGKYRMKPAAMLQLMKDLDAPLDWRSPLPHGLYWAEQGMIHADLAPDIERTEALNTDRQRYLLLREMLLRGQVVYIPQTDDPANDLYFELPDPRYAWPYVNLHDRFSKTWFEPGSPAYDAGRQRGLEVVSAMLYNQGLIAEAQTFYDRLRRSAREQGSPNAYPARLHEFALAEQRLKDNSMQRVAGEVSVLISNALHRFLLGDAPAAEEMLVYARQLHKQYMDTSGARLDAGDERALPPFEKMVRIGALTMLNHPAFAGPQHVLMKRRLWASLPAALKLPIYEEVVRYHDRLDWLKPGNPNGFELMKIFPPPVGWEEYRKQQADGE